MNNQEILDNAPKGTTHTKTLASTRIYYLKKDANGMGYSVYLTNEWRTSMAVSGFIRSLADIKRIVEIEKANNILKEPIDLVDKIIFTKESLIIHNLEQRANGIMDVRKANVRKKRTLGSIWAGGHIIHNMQLAEEELLRQAKALKEPKT